MSAIAAAAIIAGCSGSQMNPSAGQPGSAMQAHSPIGLPAVKNHCDAHGGVRVTPCTVTFDASNPGPFTVVTRTPKTKKGTLTELDACGGASGIATVVQGSGNDWIVTAGSDSRHVLGRVRLREQARQGNRPRYSVDHE